MAEENLTKSLELDFPHKELAYYFRGEVNHEMGNYEKAVEDFNQSLQLAPDDQQELIQQRLETSSDELENAIKLILDSN